MNRVIANSVPFMPKPLIGRIGRRYAAGEEIEEALRVVEGLAGEGCLATVGMLGEFATDERYIHERLNEYKRALDALEKQGLKDYRVAVKLTDLGLTLDKELCRTNLEEILLHARERGRFLEVDMEESPFVSATLDMVLDMHERYGNTGAVVQAYLRRTLEDVQRLVEAGSRSGWSRACTWRAGRWRIETTTSSGRTTCSCWRRFCAAGSTSGSRPTTSTSSGTLCV